MKFFASLNLNSRATLLAAAATLLLAGLKLLFGITGGSQALLADGIHSLSDLLIDGLVFFAAHYGSRAADQDHPYGHRRIETAAAVLLAIILVTTGIYIIIDATQVLLDKQYTHPEWIVIWVAIFSVVVNEILFRYTLKVVASTKSAILHANAWHHRSDAASSLLVVIGAGGAMLGYPYLDSLAAIIVGILITKMGISLAWSNIRELIDTGLDETKLQQIRAIIQQVSGVLSVHQLRSRTMGQAVYLDVHIIVEDWISVSEGHYLSHRVHNNLIQQMSEITDVVVHVDPEADRYAILSAQLPSREQLQPVLAQRWQALPGADQIQDMILHYLAGGLVIELRLPELGLDNQARQQLQQRYREAVSDLTEITALSLWFKPD